MINTFKDFLRSENCYDQFIYNLSEYGEYIQTDSIEEYVSVLKMNEIEEEENYIIEAFFWDNSNEGRSFWEEKHDRWEKFLGVEHEV